MRVWSVSTDHPSELRMNPAEAIQTGNFCTISSESIVTSTTSLWHTVYALAVLPIEVSPTARTNMFDPTYRAKYFGVLPNVALETPMELGRPGANRF